MLRGKKILLSICGSIAAYKAAYLTRLLKKENAEVQVIMTPAAIDFITPLTLSTLSKNPVLTSYFDGDSGTWNSHVDLGLWADCMLIAPATANTIAKMANGFCDNLLTATYLSARCPVYIAPAMDLDMYKHPATTANLDKLRSFGHAIIDAEHGELASGLTGEGRMAEPENILEYIKKKLAHDSPLMNKRVMITAGPTYEAIDPVRFIGNHSSGKMGYALAQAMADLGAQVELISGPSALQLDHPNIHIIEVENADQMSEASAKVYQQCHVAVLAAAVADYKPKEVANQKIKKKSDHLTLELQKTVDIAEQLGKLKRNGQINVGFALETEDEIENARNKLTSKNFDLIVLNSLNDEGAGFRGDTNRIRIIDRSGAMESFDLKPKNEVAKDIVHAIIKHIHK